MLPKLLPVALVAALLLAACGSDDAEAPATSAAAATTAAASSEAAAPSTEAAASSALVVGEDGCNHDDPGRDAPKTYATPPAPPVPTEGATLVLETSCGVMRFALDHALGGVVTDAVAGIAADGFYDGLSFHRVVPDFVLQGGDPEGTGAGGPGFDVAQAPPADYTYRLGDLAMAKTALDPVGTAGSQFFVISGPSGESLPPEYAVVGHATDAESLATIARIGALAVEDGPPSSPVFILSATVEPAA